MWLRKKLKQKEEVMAKLSSEEREKIRKYVLSLLVLPASVLTVLSFALGYFVNEGARATAYTKAYTVAQDTIVLLAAKASAAASEASASAAEAKATCYALPYTRKAISDAYVRAQIGGVKDLSCIETHDCFSITEYAAIDHFGLTAPGEGWKAVEDGVIEFKGACPINPPGGLIGCGHPVGATGTRQLLDAYLQVSERAGEYQVPGAKRVATLNIGGSATTNVVHIIAKSS